MTYKVTNTSTSDLQVGDTVLEVGKPKFLPKLTSALYTALVKGRVAIDPQPSIDSLIKVTNLTQGRIKVDDVLLDPGSSCYTETLSPALVALNERGQVAFWPQVPTTVPEGVSQVFAADAAEGVLGGQHVGKYVRFMSEDETGYRVDIDSIPINGEIEGRACGGVTVTLYIEQTDANELFYSPNGASATVLLDPNGTFTLKKVSATVIDIAGNVGAD